MATARVVVPARPTGGVTAAAPGACAWPGQPDLERKAVRAAMPWSEMQPSQRRLSLAGIAVCALLMTLAVGHPAVRAFPAGQEFMSFLIPLRHGQEIDDYLLDSWSDTLEDGSRTGFFRPVTSLVVLAEHAAWNGWFPGYALVNLLLHAACATLAGLMVVRLTHSRRAGLASSLLFAAHPATVEAWGIVSNRGDILATLLSLAALLVLLRPCSGGGETRRIGPAILVGLLVLLAMWAKELGLAAAAAVPAAWILLPCVSRRRVPGIALGASILAALAIYSAIRLEVFDGLGGYGYVAPLSQLPGKLACLAMQASGAS
ncbi:hypothetical protein JW921_04135, partial [Candidatus Fermentibacterales bacterium]|nr:hypothetical protein [Candidatus Fermentibacterales bacterium]